MYLYVNSTSQKYPNKIIKIFMIKHFFYLPPVSTTPVVNLSGDYIPDFVTALLGYSGAWGKLIQEKNLMLKISWHCPFN
jgi:hypothetical protein